MNDRYFDKVLWPLLFTILLMTVTGCQGRTVMAKKTSASFIQGQVLEVGTNKPIPGAIVVFTWQESISAVADTQDVCSHVEVAVTDPQGHYQLPTWKGYEPTFNFDAYKPGYVRSKQYYLTQQKNDRYIDLLEPFKGTSKERMDYLEQYDAFRTSGCTEFGTILQIDEPVYEEVKLLAQTLDDKKPLEIWRSRLEFLGYRPLNGAYDAHSDAPELPKDQPNVRLAPTAPTAVAAPVPAPVLATHKIAPKSPGSD